MDSLTDTIILVLIWAPPLVLAITLHEAAHGYAANVYGDDTAKRLGRMTLNPLAHIDLFGTVILPLLLFVLPTGFIFGYAKPVPVRVDRLNDPRWDMAKVALAGPGMNFALVLASVALMPIAGLLSAGPAQIMFSMLEASIFINLVLALVNLLPLPPLDGSRVLAAVLPPALSRKLQKLERFGFIIVIGLFFLLPSLLREVGIDLHPFETLILRPTLWLSKLLVGLVT